MGKEAPCFPFRSNGLWPVLGQRKAEHGEGFLEQGLSSRTLISLKGLSLKLGWSITWLASCDGEDAKCSSVSGAE